MKARSKYTHSNPDLCHHSIFARSNKRLNLQVLFDPFKEQFHLPACLVDISNGSGSEFKIVGQKNVMFACSDIPITDTAKLIRTFLCCRDTCKSDSLIAGQAFVLQNRLAIDHLVLPCNKEYAFLYQLVIPTIVVVTPVDDYDAVRWKRQRAPISTSLVLPSVMVTNSGR